MSKLDSVPTWLRMALGTAVPDVYKLEVRAFEQIQKRPGLGRRAFLQSMTVAAGGLVVDPGQLIWTPTKRKNIILPVAAFEQVVGVFEAHGTRYYMLLDSQGTQRHLFFDNFWRLLHAVERDRYGSGWIAVPFVTPEQAMRMVAATGQTPVELGQMACQRHHGVFDPDDYLPPDEDGLRLRRWRPGVKFTVTEVAERLVMSPVLNWSPPQQFRDLTPEETVRLVHDADQQTGVPRGDRSRRYRAPGGVRL